MNAPNQAADAYKRASLENAPPIKVIRELYQGAMRFLIEAEQIDPAADVSAFQQALHRAEAIVVELRISLEREHAPELCTELERLYLFVEDRIRLAVAERAPEPIAAAKDVLTKLASAWKEVEVATGGASEAA